MRALKHTFLSQWVYSFVGVIFLSQLCLAAGGGGADVGGGSLDALTDQIVGLLIRDNSLKTSMTNYLNTLDVNQIRDDSPEQRSVKKILSEVTQKGLLLQDVQTQNNYDATDGTCPERKLACTQIGERGGQVHFEVNRIARYFFERERTLGRAVSIDEIMIELASLALHEHIHHFQNPRTPKEQNEKDAYLIENYVKMTAKTLSIPLLRWVPIASEAQQVVSVTRYYDQDHLHNPNSAYIQVTQSADHFLTYELCLGDHYCSPIVDRKLNSLEAWTAGNHSVNHRAIRETMIGLGEVVPISAVAGPGLGLVGFSAGFTAARALISKTFQTDLMTPLVAMAGGVVGAAVVQVGRVGYHLTTDRSDAGYVLADQGRKAKNGLETRVLLKSQKVSELATALGKLIQSAPKLNVSPEALDRWDSMQFKDELSDGSAPCLAR